MIFDAGKLAHFTFIFQTNYNPKYFPVILWGSRKKPEQNTDLVLPGIIAPTFSDNLFEGSTLSALSKSFIKQTWAWAEKFQFFRNQGKAARFNFFIQNRAAA